MLNDLGDAGFYGPVTSSRAKEDLDVQEAEQSPAPTRLRLQSGAPARLRLHDASGRTGRSGIVDPDFGQDQMKRKGKPEGSAEKLLR